MNNMQINGNSMIDEQHANLFDSKISDLPMNYLGVPVSPSRLRVNDWVKLVEKVDKRTSKL